MQPLRHAPSRRACSAMVLCATALAALAGASVVEGSFPGRNGRIAVGFHEQCIFTMQPDGQARRSLACGGRPDWSPSGRRLLFLGPLGEPGVMAAGGSRQRGVPLGETPPFSSEYKPSFAPDRRHFAYTRYQPGSEGAQPEIWRAALDGKGDRLLRPGWLPRWSPKGGRIAYVSPDGGTWLMNARTGRRIHRIGETAFSLDWSPDGRWIVYTSGAADLSVARANGKGAPRRLISSGLTQAVEAVWSPNGRRIAIVRRHLWSAENLEFEIVTMDPAGRRTRLVYSASAVAEEAVAPGYLDPTLSWQPRRR